MTQRAFEGAGSQVTSMTPDRSGQEVDTAAQAAPPAAAVPASAAASTTMVTAQRRTTTQPAYRAGAVPGLNWALTPMVEPGHTLGLDLLIQPARSARAQQYPFKVISKLLFHEDVPPVVEQGNIQIRRPGWFSRIAPVLIFLLVAAALIVSTGYAVLWLLEIALPNLPILSHWLG